MPNRAESIYILIVDDDTAVREFMAEQLSVQGYKIMTADNGAEAVECVQNSKFHVVISDFRMSGMDGIETLEAIKKTDPGAQVILVSGHADVEIAVTAMKKGAFHFLAKPIMMSELFSLIEEAVQKIEFKLEHVLESAMQRAQRLFHADECSFMLMDKNDQLYIACSLGLSEEVVYMTTLKMGERVAGFAAKEGREFLIVGGLEQYPEFRGIEKHPRIRSSIVIPVFCQQKLIGVLSLNRTEYPENFTEKDLNEVSVFSSQIAQAVQDAKHQEDLEVERCQQIIKRLSNSSSENSPL